MATAASPTPASGSTSTARARTAAAAEAAQRLLDSGTPLSSGAAAAGIDVRDLRELQLLTGKPFLYATDFHNNKVDVFDSGFVKQPASATAFSAVKYLGAAYLIYIGVRRLRDRSSIVAPGSGPTPPVTTRVGMPSVCESTAAR